MKKILLIFMAFMIFAYPVHTAMFPQQADAAVASKVASQAAKKIAKEVIVDEAINTATNFALMEAIEIADKYQAKEGYKVVCPSGGSTCDKPIQVKTALSDSDKSALRGQTEIELEKAITGGKGLTKWQKFLDWFVPVWITSFAVTALTYAIDPEARSLFNEVGYNSLVALGFISPVVDTTQIEPFENVANGLTGSDIQSGFDPMGNRDTQYRAYNGTNVLGTRLTLPEYIVNQDKVYQVNIGMETADFKSVEYRIYGKSSDGITMDRSFIADVAYLNLSKDYYPIDSKVTYAVNGEFAVNYEQPTSSTSAAFRYAVPLELQTHMKKLQSIMTRSPYKIGDFYYTDILFNTVDGNIITAQITTNQNNNPASVNEIYSVVNWTSSANRQIRISAYHEQSPYKKILLPPFEEVEQYMPPEEMGSYSDDKGNVALIPPVAISYEEEATGEQVERKPNATGDGYVFEKPDGTIVPEEQVHVPPTWEPNITPSPTPIPNPGGNPDPYPEGTPQITPSPTPSNPNPEPIPLTPSPTPQPEPNPETPPGTPPPPVETTEPYFPEGETCDVGLKIPKFLPLAHSISETFPFSIPFDLYGGFEALFIEMGSERPEFEFAFDFMGKEQSWTIAIPEYFDTWKPFTDSVLIFIFDVGIIYAIYRFMGGGS